MIFVIISPQTRFVAIMLHVKARQIRFRLPLGTQNSLCMTYESVAIQNTLKL